MVGLVIDEMREKKKKDWKFSFQSCFVRFGCRENGGNEWN